MYGQVASMCFVPGLNRLWCFVESGILFLVWDLAGTLTSVVALPNKHTAHNGIWLPPFHALSFVDNLNQSDTQQVFEDVKSWLHYCILLQQNGRHLTQMAFYAQLNLIVLAGRQVQLFHVTSGKVEHKLAASKSGRLKGLLEEELARQEATSILVLKRLRADSLTADPRETPSQETGIGGNLEKIGIVASNQDVAPESKDSNP